MLGILFPRNNISIICFTIDKYLFLETVNYFYNYEKKIEVYIDYYAIIT